MSEYKKHAEIYDEGPVWFSINFRFDPLVQQAIKDAAGMGNYRFNPRKKRWFVKKTYLDAVTFLFKERGYIVRSNVPNDEHEASRAQERKRREEDGERRRRTREAGERHQRQRQQERERRERNQDAAWETLFGFTTPPSALNGFEVLKSSWTIVFRELSPRTAEQLHKRASLALHPDVGGDEESFKAMNAAFQEVDQPVRNIK